VRAFSLHRTLRIVKPSSGTWGTFVSHSNLVFGFRLPPLFLFAGIPMQIMLVVMLRESPLLGLVSFLGLHLCLGPLATSPL
jgi:hypothetical protein